MHHHHPSSSSFLRLTGILGPNNGQEDLQPPGHLHGDAEEFLERGGKHGVRGELRVLEKVGQDDRGRGSPGDVEEAATESPFLHPEQTGVDYY